MHMDGDWVFEQLSLTHLNVASILGLAIHTHRQARTHTREHRLWRGLEVVQDNRVSMMVRIATGHTTGIVTSSYSGF